MKSVKRILAIAAVSMLVTACGSQQSQVVIESDDHLTATSSVADQLVPESVAADDAFWVTVKYRSDPVDVSDFEAFQPDSSELVRSAWYDASNSYMIIDLDGTAYHYCGLPERVWDALLTTGSAGGYYLSNVKGNYDCRLGYVPSYENEVANPSDSTPTALTATAVPPAEPDLTNFFGFIDWYEQTPEGQQTSLALFDDELRYEFGIGWCEMLWAGATIEEALDLQMNAGIDQNATLEDLLAVNVIGSSAVGYLCPEFDAEWQAFVNDSATATTSSNTEMIRSASSPTLSELGVGSARLGGSGATALSTLVNYFGEPSRDSGWRDTTWETGGLWCLGVTSERLVVWEDWGMLVYFAIGGDVLEGPRNRLVYYWHWDENQSELLTTSRGLRPGDSFADIQRAYGINAPEDYPGSVNSYVNLAGSPERGMGAWLSEELRVEGIYAGASCGD